MSDRVQQNDNIKGKLTAIIVAHQKERARERQEGENRKQRIGGVSSRAGYMSYVYASSSVACGLCAVLLCCGFDVVEPRAAVDGGGGGLGVVGGGTLDMDPKAGISRTPFGTWPGVFDAAPSELGAQIVAGMRGRDR